MKGIKSMIVKSDNTKTLSNYKVNLYYIKKHSREYRRISQIRSIRVDWINPLYLVENSRKMCSFKDPVMPRCLSTSKFTRSKNNNHEYGCNICINFGYLPLSKTINNTFTYTPYTHPCETYTRSICTIGMYEKDVISRLSTIKNQHKHLVK